MTNIKELESKYEEIIHPLNFFKNWSTDEFKFWLRLNEYGLIMDHPRENDILAVLHQIEPYNELGHLQDICLQELITLKKLNLITIKN